MTNSSKVLFSSMAAEAAHNGAQRYAPRMRKTLQPLPLHTESSAEAVWWRYGSWLTGATLVLCALAMCLPRMRLPAGYHDFADQVAWGVLPYARDVLTNLAFAIAGWVLLWQGMQYSRNMQDDAARGARAKTRQSRECFGQSLQRPVEHYWYTRPLPIEGFT